MKLEYRLSLRDYEGAAKLHRLQKVSRRARFLLLYRIAPILCAAVLVLLGAANVRVHTLPNWLLLSFVIAFLWIGILMAFVPREYIRRGFKQSVSAGQVSVSIDDKCVLMLIPGVSETKMFWSAIVGSARNDELVLLYTSKDCFLIFPTIAMPIEQRTELTATIDRNLPRN